ncbi:hypothetical protein [Afipia birgiae]|uniref:hypothetical protein n=1 Tax=Afipia birgiae TaxID=151414 RepID=UPI0003144E3A|nr:hypothetical protein [Afipia birgiae]MBX9819130.1 hypothetical protein [Afipia birgiae]
MANLRTFVLLVLLTGLGVASSPMRAHAEWWRLYTPKDFEECSQSAQQPGLSKDAHAKIISECDSRFAGRRKAGGGYTYFDFMQNRHFDIAGPNPTQQELKRMDQEYLAYLETNRETPEAVDPGQAIAAINNQIRPISYQKSALPKVTAKQTAPVSRARVRKDVCKVDALSCGWAKITTTVKGLRHALLGTDTRREASAQRGL